LYRISWAKGEGMGTSVEKKMFSRWASFEGRPQKAGEETCAGA